MVQAAPPKVQAAPPKVQAAPPKVQAAPRRSKQPSPRSKQASPRSKQPSPRSKHTTTPVVTAVRAAVVQAIESAQQLTTRVLARMDDALGPVAHELLMMEALDFREITIDGPVDDVLDRAFLQFANFLNEGHSSVASG